MSSLAVVEPARSTEVAASPPDLRRFRARPDLAAYAVDRRMHVEDPIASRYFELGAEEYFVLRALDGAGDFASLASRFERRFAKPCDPRRVVEIVAGLWSQGLVVAAAPDQGPQLLARGRQASRRERMRRYGNPLAIRLPGVDPEPLLRLLAPVVRPLEIPALLWGLAAFVAVTAAYVALRAGELFAGVDLGAFSFTPRDAARLLVAVALVKTLHELGHALASRRLGGTCREIGVYLLCGAPCLYCDVTSIWRVPERWKRIAVGAAGLAVELVIAAAAFWLARWSRPGPFHSACLHVAVVASVGTLLVNGNPLLRYDGYFILSDWLGISNLRERADAAFYRATARRLLNVSTARHESEPRWLPAYAVAAWIYRTVVVVGLLWLVHRALAPAGLSIVASVVSLYAAVALVGLPAVRFVRRLALDAAALSGATRSLYLRGSVCFALLAALLAWPWPYRLPAPAVVRGGDARVVYAAVSGRLVEAVAPGTPVRRGDALVKLANLDLEREVARLRADAARRRLEIDQLPLRRIGASDVADDAASLRDALAAVEERLALAEQNAARLIVVAPVDGVAAPPTLVASGRTPAFGRPEPAPRSPLDVVGRGRQVEAGTPLCVVGDPRRRELAVLVDESVVGLVAVGARAEIRTGDGRTLDGMVREVSPVPLRDVPSELIAAGRATADQVERRRGESTRDGAIADRSPDDVLLAPRLPSYLVRVEVAGDSHLTLGTTVEVRIDAPRRSLAARLSRWAASTFRIPYE